jgi:hypothetical protein
MEERGTNITVEWLRKIAKNIMIFCLGTENRKRDLTNKNQEYQPITAALFVI